MLIIVILPITCPNMQLHINGVKIVNTAYLTLINNQVSGWWVHTYFYLFDLYFVNYLSSWI
jgi:hypothetical protein